MIVLVPCFNEETRIGQVVHSIREHQPVADIAVIDDASADNSRNEAADAGAIVLSHGCNLGYGAALETGYLYAIRHGYDIALQMDGDGQHLADQLHALLKPLQDNAADIVIGSRYSENGQSGATSLLRRMGHQVFSGLIYAVSGLKLTDPTSGFQGLSRRVLELFASGVFPCDYPDSDVILMSRFAGFRISQVPVTMAPRIGGKSMHSGLRPLYYCMKMLLSTLIVLLNLRAWRKWRSSKNRH